MMNGMTTAPVGGANLDRPTPHKEANQAGVDARKTNQTAQAQEKNAASATSETKGTKSKADVEVSEYLKSISRLENKLKKGEVTEADLGKLMKRLEEKIQSLTPQQKRVLKNMEFFMQGNLENIKEFREHLLESLMEEKDRQSAIDFLKDPKFMAMMEDKEGETLLTSYGPNQGKKPAAAAAAATNPAAQESPTPSPSPKGIKA